MISPELMGTLQYAGVHLRTPLFVVLGHEDRGAISQSPPNGGGPFLRAGDVGACAVA